MFREREPVSLGTDLLRIHLWYLAIANFHRVEQKVVVGRKFEYELTEVVGKGKFYKVTRV